jgi:hypothetical protein
MPQDDHWLPGFNFNVEEWFEGDRYETLAICRSLALARVFAAAIGEKPAGRFMIRSRTRVVRRHPRPGCAQELTDGMRCARVARISRDEAFYNRRKFFRNLSQQRSSIHPKPLPNAFPGNAGFIAKPVQIIFGQFAIGKVVRCIRAGGIRRWIAPADLKQIDNRVLRAVEKNIVRMKIAVAKRLAVRKSAENFQEGFFEISGKPVVIHQVVMKTLLEIRQPSNHAILLQAALEIHKNIQRVFESRWIEKLLRHEFAFYPIHTQTISLV